MTKCPSCGSAPLIWADLVQLYPAVAEQFDPEVWDQMNAGEQRDELLRRVESQSQTLRRMFAEPK